MDNILFINSVDRTSLIIDLKEKLQELKINIGLIVASTNEFCTCKKYVDCFVILPQSKNTPLEITVKELIEKYNIIGICVASNFDLLPLLRIKKWLDHRRVKLIVPQKKTVEFCLSKKKMYNWLSSINIQIPKVYSYEEVLKSESKSIFPLIIKPSGGQGSLYTYKVSKLNELSFYYPKISTPIIQKYISGIHYTIDCFNDENENPLIIIPRIRLIVGTSSCIVTKIDMNEYVIATAYKIARLIKIIGPWNIQLIINPEGIYVHDINPRMASGMIYSINAGAPFDYYLLELLIFGKISERQFQISDGSVFAKRNIIEIID
ncbi:MAG: ATP-grasp domain-containing protein [Bacteroidetes bacterium]|nr:ATP-grasp domain-containing protein [Bacteroidota bacterium]